MRTFIVVAALSILLIPLPNAAYAMTPTASPSDIPVPPGGGDSGLHDLIGMHSNMRNNTTIMNFIDTYGLSGWYEKTAYEGYEYVYLLPGNNHTKKLVYLNKRVNEWHINNSILWVKLIGIDEEFPQLNESEALSLGIIDNAMLPTTATLSATDPSKAGASATPDFTLPLAVVSIAISLLILDRKKR